MISQDEKDNSNNITFINPINQKEEKYYLINEEKEILLCKEDIIKEIKTNHGNNYDIKIKDLFKGNENNCYYINKEELKEKHLENLFELDKNANDLLINNQNEEEMDKLYKEVILKHPRKIIKGKIKKYSFFSWTGFFCSKKLHLWENNEFFSLGFGISSYFKTLKLFIFFFFIISCLNLILVVYYSKYKVDNNFLLKTTLSNTKITYYNSSFYYYNETNLNDLSLNCKDKLIGKVICRYRSYEINKIEDNLTTENFELNIPSKFKYYSIRVYDIDRHNKKIVSSCILENNCKIKISDKFSFYLFYECIDTSLLPENSSKNLLKYMIQGITITTSILLIVLYYFYKFGINIDNEEYYKDKVFINNYTLVLHDLKFNSDNFNKELNDLIYHLNKIIIDEIDKNNNDILEEKDLNIDKNTFIDKNEYNKHLNIFEISISSITDKKIETFKKIKSLQDSITDIRTDSDSIKKKIKKKISKSIDSISKRIKKEDNKSLNISFGSKDSSLLEDEINLSKEQEEKIEDKKMDIIEQKERILQEIEVLHKENEQKNYVEIYFTFRNPSISKIIYKIYKKNRFKIRRFFLYLICRHHKIKKYYYKGQWLNFHYANTTPSNIQWENCYFSLKLKLKRRCISFFTSIFIIAITTLIIVLIKLIKHNKTIVGLTISLIVLSVNIFSSILLNKLTLLEKYSTLTKNISSNIAKYFFLNFFLSTIFINMPSFFTYNDFNGYSQVIYSILMNMFLSIFTVHGKVIFFYCLNLLRRYIDSKFENGKKTHFNHKTKYEKLYTGSEFPIDERYSTILVNLGICLIYGTYCPLIYSFFTLFLLTTFIVDKYLIINYYIKPPYYDNYLSKITKYYLFFIIIAFFYGTIFQLSNPYLLDYYQNDKLHQFSKIDDIELYMIINPLTIIYYSISKSNLTPILIYNLTSLFLIYVIILILFLAPILILKIIKICKKTFKSSKYNSPEIDIGLIYSLDELNKYFEVKKLELFRLLVNIKKNKKKKNGRLFSFTELL